MQGLTKRQEEVLDYISSSIDDRGYPPTLREIGTHMGIKSTNGVNDHLRALEKKGYLRREDMKSRALRPVNTKSKSNTETVTVPIVGKVIPGQPLLSPSNIEDEITVDRFLVGNAKEVFGMWVKGDAMKDDGINNGDFIFVKKQMFAEKGETVVALLGDNASVRKYYPEKTAIRFVSANENCSTIMIKRQDFLPMQLLGVVLGTYRRI